MRLLIVGAPGAGKGTQSKLISEKLGIPHLSTGDILRSEISSGSELGKKVKDFVDKGLLVPDDLIADVLLNEISKDKYKKGYILDGFPRNLNQVKIMEDKGILIDKVIFIDTSEEEILKRISGRRVCLNCGQVYNIYYNPPKVENKCDKCGSELIQRDDDKEEVVKSRLRTFRDSTLPVIDYYSKKGILFRINGDKNFDDIKNEIFNVLGVE
ncbi:MAG: adenylate kinase [Brevinematia bacterium]